MLRRLRRCSRKQLVTVLVAVTVLSTLYRYFAVEKHVDVSENLISSDQLMRNEKTAVRQWTHKLPADSLLQMEHNRPLGLSKAHNRHRNIIQLENVSHGVMPVERRMPVAEAERNFHGYVSQVHVDCKIHARIGNKTDGGWDICLTPPFQLVQPCLVYSFGIGDDWSFDDHIAAKYGCVVRAFDPSINKVDHVRHDLIWFYAVGIGNENTHDPQNGWPLKKFSTLVSKCEDENKTIDILKIDVEGSEWGALAKMLEERMLNRVKQLAIEIHTPELYKVKSSIDDIIQYSTVLSQLELIGFRKWYWNFNIWGFFPARDGSKYLSCCYELVYINMNFV